MPTEQDNIDSPSIAPPAVTVRSVTIGTLCVALLCAVAPYNDFVVANTFLVGSYLPLALVLAIFLLVVLINAPLHATGKRPLSTGELAIVLTMLLVGSSIPGQGLLRTLIPSLVAPIPRDLLLTQQAGNCRCWLRQTSKRLPMLASTMSIMSSCAPLTPKVASTPRRWR